MTLRKSISTLFLTVTSLFVTKAQVQLESQLQEIKGTAFVTSIPQAPNNFEFQKPLTHTKILYQSKSTYKRHLYVDAQKGNDKNTGDSPENALQTLSALSKRHITFGTQILLKGNNVYKGTIQLNNLNNSHKSSKDKIHITSYGGAKATIDFKDYSAGIWIQNTSNVIVSDMKLRGNGGKQTSSQRYAIRILSDGKEAHSLMQNITIYNIDIQDVFLLNPVKESRACRQWDMNDNAGWGWGVFGEVVNKGKGIRNVDVKYVTVENVSQMGIRFKGAGNIDGSLPHNINNVHIENCTVFQSGGPGMQFNRCNHSHMKYCRITESGNRNDNRKWGRGSGMWTWGVNHFLLEHNTFEGAQGIADCCGAHIDFNCTNVVIQYCLSRYNCGGFIEILGKNHNCSYRYNVSVNDGWRNKNDKAQKFWGSIGTPGCIVTINGHNHDKKYVGPYNTYINNNTIISTIEGNKPYENPNVFNISTSNEGLVIMNNIFWFDHPTNAGWSMHRWKDGAAYDAAFDFMVSSEPITGKKADPILGNSYPAKIRPMNAKELEKLGLIMKNNIYRRFNEKGNDKYSKVADALPAGYWDENAIGGNPKFVNENGSNIEDFIPTNSALIQKGMTIPKLKSDKTEKGIYYGGLNPNVDILGNNFKGSIIGAIAPKE